jgi:hypothetical protein
MLKSAPALLRVSACRHARMASNSDTAKLNVVHDTKSQEFYIKLKGRYMTKPAI